MSDISKIEWTDATLNALAGCRKKSPECDGCYAINESWRMKSNPNEKIVRKFLPVVSNERGKPNWTGNVTFTEEALLAPLSRRKPTKYFVNSLSDLFYSEVSDEWIDKHFAVFALAPQHIFQVLTKRPEKMADYLSKFRKISHLDDFHCWASEMANWCCDRGICYDDKLSDDDNSDNLFDRFQESVVRTGEGVVLPNVWLGCSVGNQKYADERREAMRKVSEMGWTTFVSYEPALGPVDWTGWEFLDWIVSGGESGSGARPSHPDWHRATRDFCQANDIAYHFKQWGEWYGGPKRSHDTGPMRICRGGVVETYEFDKHPDSFISFGLESVVQRVGKKKAGRILDGREWNEFPEVAR